MTSPVQLDQDGAIAVIRFANPPVNALSNAVRSALYEALETARAQADMEAIVVAGRGTHFSGGADITEFGAPAQFPTTPDLVELLDRIENRPSRRSAASRWVADWKSRSPFISASPRRARSSACRK